MTKLHILQHVPFETPGYFELFVKDLYQISVTHVYRNDSFPELSDFDLLIILGGPMNIYECNRYPWLTSEKVFIKHAIDNDKKVLGICLGAQLIADVLGARVIKNEHKEIGWFPVYHTPEIRNSVIFKSIPDPFYAFHWHGDTFEIPAGSTRIAATEACKNQGFIYNDKVIGIQFHLETTEQSVKELIDNCTDELIYGKYIQTEKEIILQSKTRMYHSNQYLDMLLRNFLNDK